MTKMVAVYLLSTVLLSRPMAMHGGVSIKENEVQSEETLIKQAVENLYIEGLMKRDFAIIESICIPETHLMSAGKDGKLHVTTLPKWSKRFDPNNPPFKKLEYSIAKVDRAGTAAQVKIAFVVDSTRHVTDFVHMLKLDGEWRIVNIIDH
jgi:hypothetical protein